MITVSLATRDDAPLVHQIMIAAFEEYRGVLEPPSSTHDETVNDVRRAFDSGGAVLARLDGAAVGSARFQPRPGYLYVGRVSTLPAWRGRGVGAALMTFLLDHARALGLPEVRVEVRLSLPSNVALYRRLGFHTISEQPHPRGPQFRTVILGHSTAE
jgi:ribosomal protein S18 acetylase RimI-like enzyme